MERLLKELVIKEELSGVYNITVGGIPIYNYVRQYLRRVQLEADGISCMDLVSPLNKKKAFASIIKSSYQVTRLIISNRKYSNVFFAFPRIDRIAGKYFDKFTDPFIDCGVVGDDYVIFENGRAGSHEKPRTHAEKVVYADCVTFLAKLSSFFCAIHIPSTLRNKLEMFFKCLDSVYSPGVVDKNKVIELIVSGLATTRMYVLIFNRIGAKRIFAPARPYGQFIAAHCNGMKCYEMQHGITYGESILYSGYNEPSMTPDLFLAFGNNKPDYVYGIDPSKMVNVGWPLPEFMSMASSLKYGSCDILVVSDPEVSIYIIQAVLELACAFPESHFYIRPHPHEHYDDEQLAMIISRPNVHIQDNSINISEVLQGFENVIGENSSVLYEALSMNKKAGKLYYPGLNPLYLSPDDVESFWEIRDTDDLNEMIIGHYSDKKSKSIYSPFDKEAFSKLLENNTIH